MAAGKKFPKGPSEPCPQPCPIPQQPHLWGGISKALEGTSGDLQGIKTRAFTVFINAENRNAVHPNAAEEQAVLAVAGALLGTFSMEQHSGSLGSGALPCKMLHVAFPEVNWAPTGRNLSGKGRLYTAHV